MHQCYHLLACISKDPQDKILLCDKPRRNQFINYSLILYIIRLNMSRVLQLNDIVENLSSNSPVPSYYWVGNKLVSISYVRLAELISQIIVNFDNMMCWAKNIVPQKNVQVWPQLSMWLSVIDREKVVDLSAVFLMLANYIC